MWQKANLISNRAQSMSSILELVIRHSWLYEIGHYELPQQTLKNHDTHYALRKS